MATIDDLIDGRAAAGAAYSAAAQAYLAAWVELHAYDMAVGNAAFAQGEQNGFNELPVVLLHPAFLHGSFGGTALVDAANARNVALIRSVS